MFASRQCPKILCWGSENDTSKYEALDGKHFKLKEMEKALETGSGPRTFWLSPVSPKNSREGTEVSLSGAPSEGTQLPLMPSVGFH